MSDEIERLLVRVEANAAQFESQMRKVNRALYGSAAETRKTLNQIKRDFDRAGRDLASSFAPVQLAASVALGAIVAFSYNAAKRAEAVQGAFEQTFRDMPEEAKKAVSAVAEEFGRLETDVKDNFTQLRSVLTALGVEGEQALAITDALNRRALDIAAFRNVSDAEAFRAVISGITGETEPLKRFGIVVNETAVKAELLRLGFKGNAQQASEAAKSIARANIVLRQSAEMHGQVSRESDQLAEQEKRTRAEFTKAAEDFGQKFLPVAADVLKWASDALDAFTDLPEGVQMAGLALLAFVAASGPVGAAITGLRALIAAAVAARAALAAVGGAGVAGAAGRGASLAAAGALGLGGTVAAGTGIVLGTTSFAPAPYRGDDLDRQLAQARERQGRAERAAADTFLKSREVVRQQQAAVVRAREEVATLTRQIEARATAEAQRAADEAASAALASMGDFGLSGAQGTPVGGGGGRGGRQRQDRTPELRAALALELDIARARSTGDEATIRAAEEREELARLVEQYESAGYADAQARATEHLALLNQAALLAEEREKAEEEVDKILRARERQMEREADYAQLLNEQLMDQLGMQAEIARLSGNEGALRDAERRIWLEERTNEILRLRLALTREEAAARAAQEYAVLDDAEAKGQFRDFVVSTGLDFGEMVEEAGDRFKRRALEGLADALWNIVSGAFSQAKGGGGGNWLTAIGSAIFGGFRANGGPVSAGRAYVVGERRPEVFVPSTSGTILPSVAAAASGMAGGGGAQRVVVEVDLKNDMLDARIDNRAAPMVQRGTQQAVRQSVQINRRSLSGAMQRQQRLGTV